MEIETSDRQAAGTSFKRLSAVQSLVQRMVETVGFGVFNQTAVRVTFVDQLAAPVIPEIILVDGEIERVLAPVLRSCRSPSGRRSADAPTGTKK